MNDKQQLAAIGERMREVTECKPEFKVPDGWKLVPAHVSTPEVSWPIDVGAHAFRVASNVGCPLEDCIYDAIQMMLAAAPEYKP